MLKKKQAEKHVEMKKFEIIFFCLYFEARESVMIETQQPSCKNWK